MLSLLLNDHLIDLLIYLITFLWSGFLFLLENEKNEFSFLPEIFIIYGSFSGEKFMEKKSFILLFYFLFSICRIVSEISCFSFPRCLVQSSRYVFEEINLKQLRKPIIYTEAKNTNGFWSYTRGEATKAQKWVKYGCQKCYRICVCRRWKLLL